MLETKTRYCIKFANGNGWEIAADDKTRPWIDRLSSIMELSYSKSNSYPKLTFISTHLNNLIDQSDQYHSEIKEKLNKAGWKAYDTDLIRFWFHQDTSDVICEILLKANENRNFNVIRMWSSLAPIYLREQKFGGTPFHAGLIEREGLGFLISAPSGTGKSTCCKRIPPPWKPLCDDEVLIVKDTKGNYNAHPFPTWSEFFNGRTGLSWNVQRSVLLSAIFFLEQSKYDEVIPIRKGKASILALEAVEESCEKLWISQSIEEKIKLKELILNNTLELVKNIPAFILRASLNGEFWKKMEGVLKNL